MRIGARASRAVFTRGGALLSASAMGVAIAAGWATVDAQHEHGGTHETPSSAATEGHADNSGMDLFMQDCAGCHGDNAAGAPPGHEPISPPPANLTLVRDAPSMLLSIVQNGVPSTLMPPHPDIDRQAFQQVLDFLKSLPQDKTREWHYPETLQNAEENRAVWLEFGRKIYVTSCRGCHGEEGDGRSEFADNPLVWPKPANFVARNSVPGRIYHIVSHGRPGTMMPPQGDVLPEMARWAVSLYIASLFDETSTATIETPPGEVPKVKNPYEPKDAQALAQAEDTYNLYCIGCHGAGGAGTFLAPALNDGRWYLGGGTDTALWVVLEEGVPGKLMPGWKALSEDDRWRLITLIRHWGGLPDPSAERKGHEHGGHGHGEQSDGGKPPRAQGAESGREMPSHGGHSH